MNKFLPQLCFCLSFLVYLSLLGNRSGAPAGRTGAPGENSCGTGSCHNTNANTGSATFNLTLNDNQTAYQPGEKHKIAIAIENAVTPGRNGFEIVALDAQDNNIGEWILEGIDIRERTGSDRNFITHTEDGSSQAAWEIDWQAPTEDVGAITFYAAAIDANNNGGRTGDDLYTTSLSVEAEVASSVKEIASLVATTIFPNPVGDQLNIRFELTSNTFLTGHIYTTAGQAVYSLFKKNIPRGNSFQSFPIPPRLSSGQYFLELTSMEGAVQSISFIKK